MSAMSYSHDIGNWINFCDLVTDAISDEFLGYGDREDWFVDSDQCTDWMNKLYRNGASPAHAAKVIERAHRLYIAGREVKP